MLEVKNVFAILKLPEVFNYDVQFKKRSEKTHIKIDNKKDNRLSTDEPG